MRARLNVLSELPEEWQAALERWAALTRSMCPPLIDRFDQYVVHQTLLGAWPTGRVDGRARRTFVLRIQDYLVKDARERAERTTWDRPDETYEAALRAFVCRLMNEDEAASRAFVEDRASLQERVTRFGALNSLAQVLLKCTIPGVPDIYQGCELWDLSLVDPDNRRPVDYAERERANARVRTGDPQTLLQHWRDGDIKLCVLASALRYRRDCQPFYLNADYAPIEVTGERAANAIAFARVLHERAVITVVPRLPTDLMSEGDAFWSPRWADTALVLPVGLRAGNYRDVFTQRQFKVHERGSVRVLFLAEALGTFPVALLEAA